MKSLIDISPMIRPATAVFPGDVPFSRDVTMDMKRGDHLTLSSFRATCHIGAHADAPNHYLVDGEEIAERPLDLYYGPCRVLCLEVGDHPIKPEDIDEENLQEVPERVLFRTGSFSDPSSWQDRFTSLSPSLIETLAGRGVRLVGIDTPSIDPSDSKTLDAHQAVGRHDMAILEGLVLAHVEPGDYTLIALPLKIEGADAGPVRAALEA